MPVTASLVASHIGLRVMGLAMGLISAGHALGAAAGAFSGGYIFDLTQRYDWVWISSLALAVGAGVDPVAREDLDHPAGSEHRRGEARALLVGPGHDIERAACLHASVVQCGGDFERGDHAEDAVEAPAARHRVEVRANEDRREVGFGPLAPPVDIAEVVHARCQSLLL